VKKIAQNVAQRIFCPNLCTTFTIEKRSLKICAISVIFITLAKVNNDPLGQNSPNLVTLVAAEQNLSFNFVS
jgi:hypothetical protein